MIKHFSSVGLYLAMPVSTYGLYSIKRTEKNGTEPFSCLLRLTCIIGPIQTRIPTELIPSLEQKVNVLRIRGSTWEELGRQTDSI